MNSAKSPDLFRFLVQRSRIAVSDRVRDDAPALLEGTAMVTIREETPADVAARERLLDACFGPRRFEKTCERLRAGRRPARGLSLVADHYGEVVGTVRLWEVAAGRGRRALLLGPLAVACEAQGQGIGAALIREALARAAAVGHGAVLLVGDTAYYERFGFAADLTGALTLPGPYERERFLGLELVPGALAGARGRVTAHGEPGTRQSRAPHLAAQTVERGPRLAA